MRLHFNIQGKLLALGLAGIGFATAVGLTGYVAATRLTDASARITQVGESLRQQMSADQSHDALRADVLAALHAGAAHDLAAEKSVRDELQQHTREMREAIRHLEGMPMDDAVRAALREVRPAIDAYLASASALADKAFADGAAADAALPAFMQAFERLEKEMAALSTLIEGHARQVQADSERTAADARNAILAAMALATGVMLGACVLVSRRIVRPLRRAVAVAEQVAAGDLSVRIEASASNDETGQLLAALARMNDALVAIVTQVRLGADNIVTGAGEIASGNQDLSQRTEEQASNLQQTAASIEQLSSTVQHSAANASQAAQLAVGARDVASRGGQVVQEVVATMGRIGDSSRRIADIIGVIDGIAFQTNILALNAAVEAARAGEQGRGFAVVAGEVRALAHRSATAAREIKSLIHDSAETVQDGARLVSQAGETIADIVTQVQRVNDLVGEISVASHEQSQGIGQVNQAVGQLDQVTQQNAALVEEAAAASESLSSQARQLAQSVAVFRLA